MYTCWLVWFANSLVIAGRPLSWLAGSITAWLSGKRAKRTLVERGVFHIRIAYGSFSVISRLSTFVLMSVESVKRILIRRN